MNVSETLNLPSARVRFRLLHPEPSRSRSGRQYAGGRFRRHRLTKKSLQPADNTPSKPGKRAEEAHALTRWPDMSPVKDAAGMASNRRPREPSRVSNGTFRTCQ
jgi:hypothetical protein